MFLFWRCLKDLKMYISMTPTRYSFGSHNKTCSHIGNQSVVWQTFYIANRIRKATIKQNSPMASERANPRMAYENSCCFRDGFLQTSKNSNLSENSKVCFSSVRVKTYHNQPCIANDEATKHCPNTSSRSSHSDCGSSSTNKLCSGVNVPADSTGLEGPHCDLGEGALWHHSNTALYQRKRENHRVSTRSSWLIIPQRLRLMIISGVTSVTSVLISGLDSTEAERGL